MAITATTNKTINMEREVLILIGIFISALGLWLAWHQFKEQKEINELQRQIHQHELDKINIGK